MIKWFRRTFYCAHVPWGFDNKNSDMITITNGTSRVVRINFCTRCESLYAVKAVDTRWSSCRHCQKFPELHTNGKCLFQPTHYQASS